MQLRTGLPGTFKSCGAVEQLIKYANDPAYKDRPRYFLGITNLRPDLAEAITEEQFKDWKSLPVGAIVVVDEAQKLMPARRSGDAPQFIKDMSEHRHRGIEFIFITQNPGMLDKYVRTLVDRHFHHVRKFGSMWAERWEFDHCEDDPLLKRARDNATGKEFVRASTEAMESYTSAQMHTIKRSTPRYLKVALVLVFAIPLAFYAAYHKITSISDKQVGDLSASSGAQKDEPKAPVSGSHAPVDHKEKRDDHHVMTTAEWVARFEPRVPGMPWSAPAYDDRRVEGTPELYCIIMDVGEVDEHCRCNTEQGTRAQVPASMCRTMARDGTYNPYRKPQAPPDSKERGRDRGTDPEAIDVASAARPRIEHVRDPGGASQAAAQASAARIGTNYLPPDQTTAN